LLVCLTTASLTAACSATPPKSAAQVAPKAQVQASTADPGLSPAVAREPAPRTLRVSSKAAAGDYRASRVSGDYAGHPAAERFIDRMEREEGFDPDYLAGLLSRVDRQQWILDFLNRPKSKGSTGPTGAWTRYRAKFLTPDNIAGGARFWSRYSSVLDRAHAKYGVPPEYVVAILGVETRYGGYMGSHKVVEALATLAFDYPRRSDFFTDELAAFLVMARDEGFDPFQPKGSYAGAMGLGQFMPSSFHKWAVDFDGDGRRDLWNPVDAIGSVANYFASFGWRNGTPVTVRASVSGAGAGAMKTGFDTSYSLDALQREGIRPRTVAHGQDSASLLRLDARGGYEYWLGFDNFYVITRYNHSTYYAMAVHQLAQAVKDRHGPAPGTRLTQTGGSEGGEPAL